ncbi:MAG: ABC transporter ATP-binding protein/permease [Defluviitaleaceae bacterium]|nr:ABC transporter ATP-binding protein/permease [Defluviitaleaceae bacterium]
MKKIADIKLICRGVIFINSIEKGLIQLMTLNAIISAIVPFINIYMISILIDGILNRRTINELVIVTIMALLVNGITLVSKNGFTYFINLKVFKFEKKFNLAISNKMSKIPFEKLESPEIHNLRMSIEEVKTIYGSRIQKIMIYFPSLASAFFSIVFSISITMSLFFTGERVYWFGRNTPIMGPLFSIIFILIFITLIMVSIIFTSKFTTKKINLYDKYTPFIKFSEYYQNQYLGSYHAGKDIRLYNQRHLLESEFLESHEYCKKVDNEVTKLVYKSDNINSIISHIIAALSYVYVAIQAIAGYLSVGLVVRYVQSLNQFVQGFTQFMNTSAALFTSNEYIKKTLDFMSIEEEKDLGERHVEYAKNIEIEFQDVFFKYPNQENYALNGITVKINARDCLAIVGENGSGKTTLIKLLCGLYKPTKGKILLNGIDVSEYRKEDYMSLFAVVFQDCNVFSFSICDNIALNDIYDKDKIIDNLERVGFNYKKYENGIDSNLYKDFYESGIEISGGEKQKIAIARALNKDTEIIILDEPTAALDPIAEFELYQKFSDITKGKTTISISHRLSSCRLCENILVFHEGRIVQAGSHEELLEDELGKYYELWNAQAIYYK